MVFPAESRASKLPLVLSKEKLLGDSVGMLSGSWGLESLGSRVEGALVVGCGEGSLVGLDP